jgi:thiamine biosynthesis lipoprotein
MSSLQWRDWSCTVRVVLADGRPADEAPPAALAHVVEDAVRSLMGEVAHAVSRFHPDTDLLRVNDAAGRLVPVAPLTLELVQVALDAARSTDGACDPTVGAHLLAAGYDVDIDELRDREVPADREAPLRRADWRSVRVDRGLGLVGVPAGLRLDLGASAKAWTADAAASRVHRGTGLAALVSLGGDLAVAGPAPAWPVLVGEHEGGAGEVLRLDRGGLATSSTRGRRWSAPDGERHHVIDPRTGRPADGPFRTVSVLAESCVAANVLTTAALVWGAEAPARLDGHAARLVATDGTVTTTSAWPASEPWTGAAA